MNDFIICVSAVRDVSTIQKAKSYLNKIYPDISVNEYLKGNYAIVYTTDPYNCDPILIRDDNRNIILILSGDIEISTDIMNETELDQKSSLRSHISSLYQKHGHAIFSKFSGSFNCVSYDFKSGNLFATNSKLALFPLYYFHKESYLLLSTRLGVFKEILSSYTLNDGVLMQQCLYNYPFSGQTAISGVKLQPSASTLSFSNTELQFKKHWNVGSEVLNKHGNNNYKQSVDLLDQVLKSTVEKICRNNNTIAISLTGGWDGRLLLTYALKYLPSEQVLLYSHGTGDAPDVTIPLKTSEKLGYNYVPIYLDNPDYVNKQLHWAFDTLTYSDALRQIKRCHYLYSMSILKNKYDMHSIMSGIGGSNLLKSSNIGNPSDVYNKYVLELLQTDNPEPVLIDHYNHIQRKYPGLFSCVKLEEFINSFDENDFTFLIGIKNKNERFLYFLLSEIERKWFGAEVKSYRHLVKNYSPFFDDRFIYALSQTVFFNMESKKGIRNSNYISLLYAQLTGRHNPDLAKEKTDRGFSMYDLSKSYLLPKVAYKYLRNKLQRRKNVDYYNTRNLTSRFVDWHCPDLKSRLAGHNIEDSAISNYVSIMAFYNKHSK